MTCTSRSWALSGTAAVLAALATGCSASANPDDTTTCDTEADCPAGRHCVDHRCIGGTDGGADADADADIADDDGGGEAGCVDLDHDRYGRGCAAGPDCDDADPALHADCPDCATTHAPGCRCSSGETFACYDGPPATRDVGVCRGGTRSCVVGLIGDDCAGQVLPVAGPDDVCNDLDDDCNGTGDESLYGVCGNCDPSCDSDGPVVPSPSDPGASGLQPNPDGPGVVLGTEDIAAGYAWVANAGEGTVSKLDLASGAEVARFAIGRTGSALDSPSRTAVDGLGNAYVANRALTDPSMNQGSVTKMAGDRRYCVDRNGNTVIDTSGGSAALPLGTDECVIWTVDVGGPGGIPRSLAIDSGSPDVLEGFPWVGCWNEMRFYKLDPDTGAVLNTVDVSVNPYGAAIDAAGWIWVSGMRPLPGYIQRFNVTTLAVDPPISTASTGCTSPSDAIYSPYGITVDIRNRVWIGSWSPNVCRYDPADGSWLTVPVPGGGVCRGVAADADGTIWASRHAAGNSLVSFPMDAGAPVTVRDTAGVTPIGVGVDELGHVWTVNQGSNTATRLTKLTGVLEEFPVGLGPYTYSDFTGYQRRLLVPRGLWQHDYERCARDPSDHWGDLTWDVTAPPGQVTIMAASASTVAGLDTAPNITLAVSPPAVPPVDLAAAFAAAGVPTDRYLRITVMLEGSSDGRSPVFRSVHVQWHCSIIG